MHSGHINTTAPRASPNAPGPFGPCPMPFIDPNDKQFFKRFHLLLERPDEPIVIATLATREQRNSQNERPELDDGSKPEPDRNLECESAESLSQELGDDSKLESGNCNDLVSEPDGDSEVESVDDLEPETADNSGLEPSNDLAPESTVTLGSEPGGDLKVEPGDDLESQPDDDSKLEPGNKVNSNIDGDLELGSWGDLLRMEAHDNPTLKPGVKLISNFDDDLKPGGGSCK